MNPLVSIITPCYNGEEFIKGYFEMVLAQTYLPLELIFVNDGSTDRTEEIALSYGDALEERGIIFKYCYQPNGGQAKAMNTGFQKMTGKYLVWPDSDDILESDSIEKRVTFLENNPQYLFVRSNGDYVDYETKEHVADFGFSVDNSHDDIFMDLILEQTYCACGCYMIKTETLRDIYPDLRIYESSAGQNWQILLPVAGRGLCGYIDDMDYHVVVRKNSHSRYVRALDEEVARRMELKKVLEIGIALSGRTDQDYAYIVDMKYLNILFAVCVRNGAHEQAKKYYAVLKGEHQVEKRFKELYIKTYCPMQYRLYTFFGRIKRVCNRLIHKSEE